MNCRTSYAFSRIEAALNFVINNLEGLSRLAAETERLSALMDALDLVNPNSNEAGAGQGGRGGGGSSEVDGWSKKHNADAGAEVRE